MTDPKALLDCTFVMKEGVVYEAKSAKSAKVGFRLSVAHGGVYVL